MIKSDVKKKIEASATITNTMIVVIVVSRRVGQVTLAVSERTSCRNLNGLKAIVDMIRSVRRFSVVCGIRTALQRPALVSKDEPPSGLDCSGEIKAAPDIRQSGPAAGGGYVLRRAPKVKVPGTGETRTPSNGPGPDRSEFGHGRGPAGLETLLPPGIWGGTPSRHVS